MKEGETIFQAAQTAALPGGKGFWGCGPAMEGDLAPAHGISLLCAGTSETRVNLRDVACVLAPLCLSTISIDTRPPQSALYIYIFSEYIYSLIIYMCNIHLTHIYNFFYQLFEGRVQTWCCPFAPKYFSVCFLKAKTFSSVTKYNDHNRQFTSVQSNYLIYFLQILPVVPWIFSTAKQNKMFLVRFMLFRVMFLWIPSVWNDCSSFSNSRNLDISYGSWPVNWLHVLQFGFVRRDLMIGLRWCVVGRHTREAVLVLRAPLRRPTWIWLG